MQSANEPDRIPTRPVRVPLVRHDRPPSNESSSEKPPSPLGSPPTIPSDTMKTPYAETFDPYNSTLNDDVRSMRYTPQGYVDLYGCSESDPEPSYVDASWRADSWRVGPPLPRSQMGIPDETTDLWNDASTAELELLAHFGALRHVSHVVNETGVPIGNDLPLRTSASLGSSGVPPDLDHSADGYEVMWEEIPNTPNHTADRAARARRRRQVQSLTEDLQNFDLNEDLQACINTDVYNCPE